MHWTYAVLIKEIVYSLIYLFKFFFFLASNDNSYKFNNIKIILKKNVRIITNCENLRSCLKYRENSVVKKTFKI